MTSSSDGPGSGGSAGNGPGKGSSGPPGGRRLKKFAASTGTRAGGAYQGAMEAVFAIVGAVLIGAWVDSRFGTSPRWLIVGVIVGFGAFVLRLARMAKLVDERTMDEQDPETDGEASRGAGRDRDED